MNIVELERALTAFFATKLELTLDSNIFRGAIPIGHDGLTVRIDSEIRNKAFDAKTYNVQLCGKYSDRDNALVIAAAISNSLPLWGICQNSIMFRSLYPRGGVAVWQDADDGKLKYFLSANLIVVC